jgi:hypothetical protein
MFDKTTLESLKKHFGIAILSQTSQLFLCNQFKNAKYSIINTTTKTRKTIKKKKQKK